MVRRTLLAVGLAAGMAAITAPLAFAQTGAASSTTTLNSTAKIACVGAAVQTREVAIDAAMTTYTGAVNAAHAARATALKAAYSETTLSAVKAAVKSAWATFRSTITSARSAWQSARDSAWKTYRTAAVACKAPVGTGDGINSTSETAGT